MTVERNIQAAEQLQRLTFHALHAILGIVPP